MSKNVDANDDVFLKVTLLKFFQKKENIERFLPILTRTSSVSLRLLDYFCVTYAKETPVSYFVANKYFDAYASYKNQLHNFSKKKFDPFKRNARIPLCYNGKKYYTTIAQLCFFKWCLTYNVVDYVEKHKNEINEDMKNTLSRDLGSEMSTDESGSTNSGSRLGKSSRRKRSSNITAVATRVIGPGNDDIIIMSFE